MPYCFTDVNRFSPFRRYEYGYADSKAGEIWQIPPFFLEALAGERVRARGPGSSRNRALHTVCRFGRVLHTVCKAGGADAAIIDQTGFTRRHGNAGGIEARGIGVMRLDLLKTPTHSREG